MTALEKVSNLYSVSDLQTVSNNSHLMWGISLSVVSFLLFMYAFGYKKNLLSLVIPTILLFTISFFSIYLFFNRGLANFFNSVQMIFSFPEFYVHIGMALVTTFGIIIELLFVLVKTKHQLAPLALPLSSVGVGYLFIIHPRSGIHDENTMFIHALIGSAFVFAGIMLILQRLINNIKFEKVFTIFASISLSASALLLIQFKEPVLAYQAYFPVQEDKLTALDIKDGGIVYITENGVVPQNIKIKSASQITFFQADASLHDISSGPHPTHTEYPPLNIGFLKRGESKTVTFPTKGSFGFHDHLNDGDTRLQGKIEVYE